jgi:Ulp1 family protease
MILTVVFFQIYVPIATDHHYSLVIVSHTLRKKFILDSWGGEHKKEVRDVLTNLELYLSNTHGMDISGYEEETPAVEHQINK